MIKSLWKIKGQSLSDTLINISLCEPISTAGQVCPACYLGERLNLCYTCAMSAIFSVNQKVGLTL